MEFSIHPAYEGNGIGGCLINYVKSELDKEKVGNLDLTTVRDYPAVKFYEKHGFKLSESVVFMHT